MSKPSQIRRALISVYDKTGLVEFARALHQEFGIELISTGGTAKVLKDAGLPVTLVEEITGFPEMLDGRVKTLHPKIHAAILADRDNPEHMRQLKEQGIEPIDMVVVNLYPFEQTIARPGCTFEEAIEMIDIGGPCLLRAAAKNHRHVLVVYSPYDYPSILRALRGDTSVCALDDWASSNAFHVFGTTMKYDGAIYRWLGGAQADGTPTFFHWEFFTEALLRYGENPHQAGRLVDVYQIVHAFNLPQAPVYDTNLTEELERFSFNNLADASAALELCAELTRGGSAKLCFAPRSDDPGSPGSAKLCLAPRSDGPGASASSTGHSDRTPLDTPGSPNSLPDDANQRFALPQDANQRFALPEDAHRAAAHSGGSAKLRFAPIHHEIRTRRNLPHWQIPGATCWVTFTSAVGQLTEPERDTVLAALRYWDGKRLDLHAAVVMTDHVHALLSPRAVPNRPGEFFNLAGLLRSIKGFAGREISQRRGGIGRVWTLEGFDRWIRNEADFAEKWRYIAENVVKEGLALAPGDYRWWYAVDFLGLGVGTPVRPDTPRPAVLGGPASPGAAGERSTETRRKPEVCAPPAPTARKPEVCAPPVCCFIKHTNACGVAVHPDRIEAYRKAYLGDPNAALGGILAVNFPVDAEFASAVMQTYTRWGKPLKDAGAAHAPGGFFVEVWLAPSFYDDAVKLIRGELEPSDALPNPPKKDWGQRVRLLAVGDMSVEPDPGELDFKRIAGGMLMQTRDLVGLDQDQWKVVTQRRPTEQEMDDLRLAWLICKHTKSNAITICKEGMLIGNGAGQMSRVMSCRIAAWLAQENGHADQLKGAAAASDAFFPFRDGPDILMDAGVTALIQPGGSKRDQEVIGACNARGAAMIFTGTRHFRH